MGFTANEHGSGQSVAFSNRRSSLYNELSEQLFSGITMPPNYRGPQLPVRSSQKFKSWLTESWLVTILALQPIGILAIYWANKAVKQKRSGATIAARVCAHKAAFFAMAGLITSLIIGLGLVILYAGPY